MTASLLVAFAGFAFVSTITPGPNNLMLMASGANFRFRRSIPHIAGITLGFSFMVFLVGIGIVAVFDRFPFAYTILKYASAAYLIWLSWRIANAAPPKASDAGGKPFTFLQAAAFQWVNPKAWTMALTAATVYMPQQTLFWAAVIAGIFGMIGAPCMIAWTILGQEMRRILTTQGRLRVFNIGMAVILVASLVPAFLP